MGTPTIQCLHDELAPAASLKPHPKNRNQHSDEQVERLAKLLKYQGVRAPIVVSKRSGFIVKGHGTLLAIQKAGLDHAPVVHQDFESDEQEYAFVQSDNAIAAWAELDLSGINSDLGELGPDFNIDMLGLKDFALTPVETIEPGCDEDEVPEHVEPKTKLGDVYTMGRHRLMCGDSTGTDIATLMGPEIADVGFTSPPYNLGISAKLRGNSQVAKQANVYGQYDDNQDQMAWLEMVEMATVISLKYSKYAFWNIQPLAGNRRAIWNYAHRFSDRYCDILIWDKQHAPPQQAERVVNSRFEFVWCFTDDANPTRAIRVAPAFRGTIDNVYSAPLQRNNEESATHGATFPCHFPEHFISSFCPERGSVLDLFGGSGTTMIACEKLGRKCFMMELDPHYCDVIVARWEKYTGKKAELVDG